MEIFGLIENMSGLVCPHCNCDVDLFGTGGGEETASQMGVSFLGRIPFDPELVSCSDEGAAYLDKHPDSPVSNAYREIAEKLTLSMQKSEGSRVCRPKPTGQKGGKGAAVVNQLQTLSNPAAGGTGAGSGSGVLRLSPKG